MAGPGSGPSTPTSVALTAAGATSVATDSCDLTHPHATFRRASRTNPLGRSCGANNRSARNVRGGESGRLVPSANADSACAALAAQEPRPGSFGGTPTVDLRQRSLRCQALPTAG